MGEVGTLCSAAVGLGQWAGMGWGTVGERAMGNPLVLGVLEAMVLVSLDDLVTGAHAPKQFPQLPHTGRSNI